MADYNDQVTVPAAFPEILKDLNREVIREQPKDIYQFCANYFFQKLAEQRTKLITIAAEKSNEFVPVNGVVGLREEEILKLLAEETTTSNTTAMDTDTPEATKPQPNETATNEDADLAASESDDDDDEEDDSTAPLPPPVTYNRGRRTSVSAESMAPTTDTDFVKIIIPKTEEQRVRIQASIKNNFLFRSCDEEQYTDVVNAMSEKHVAAGEDVIVQGAVGDYFYVVETGSLDVFVSRNGQPAEWKFNYGPGGSFGELALMYNAPRAATVRAQADSVLWALDRVTFRRILMENTSRKRRMYESFLEEVPILLSLEPYERHKIADALESVVFNDGDVVIRQGDVGDNFYIIESGDASVTTTDKDGIEHEMPGLHRGDYFGELALLTNEPRRATVKAVGRLKLATLGKKAFVRLLGPVVDIIKRNAGNYSTIAEKIRID
ncbi:hypothetical protein HDU97_000841 [Phlyctochytrium planicorne]|nr:hypothetical protein HDU97_000841 [Phlyctochytrium planicorne]